MIREKNQQWEPEQVVKVGFTTLRVKSVKAVKDGLPDIYTLESLNGTKRYEFIPYNGLRRIDEEGKEIPRVKSPTRPKRRHKPETEAKKEEEKQVEEVKKSVWSMIRKRITGNMIIA
jgi:hypothetical protein